jgi:hypothetical protein
MIPIVTSREPLNRRGMREIFYRGTTEYNAGWLQLQLRRCTGCQGVARMTIEEDKLGTLVRVIRNRWDVPAGNARRSELSGACRGVGGMVFYSAMAVVPAE